MKKLLIVLALIILPLSASAAIFEGGEDIYVLDTGDTLTDNLYVGSLSVVINGIVDGDVWATGKEIVVSGSITEDTVIVGEQVSVGNIGGDVRTVGANIAIEQSVGGDVLVLGENVVLTTSSSVMGDVRIIGANVTLAGTVNGDVQINAQNVQINGTVNGDVVVVGGKSVVLSEAAIVGGDIVYNAPQPSIDDTQAKIGGDVVYQRITESTNNTSTYYIFVVLWFMVKIVTWVIVALAATWFARRWFAQIATHVVGAPVMNMIYGLAVVIGAPVVIILLLVSVIGIGIALIVAVLLAILLFVTKITSFVVAGTLLNQVITKTKKYAIDWKVITLGVVAVLIVGEIPVAGFILKSLLCLATLGAIVSYTITSRKK